MSTTIFRILQEALTNVVRHSGATSVRVDLGVVRGSVVMHVQDNGTGIKESERREYGSFGILGMKERALAVGGTVDVTGSPFRGTTVRLSIPLSERI